MAPPLNFCLHSHPDENHPIREQFRRKGRPASDSNLSYTRLNTRITTIVNEWDSLIQDLVVNEKTRQSNEHYQQSFVEGNRGCFWKCVGCSCVIHEHCLDFVDQWMLYKDSSFKCKEFQEVITRLYVLEVPFGGSFYRLYNFAIRSFLR